MSEEYVEEIKIIGEGFITVTLPEEKKFTLIKFHEDIQLFVTDKTDKFGSTMIGAGMEDFKGGEWVHAALEISNDPATVHLHFGDGSVAFHVQRDSFETS